MLFFLVLVEEEVAVAIIELTPVPGNNVVERTLLLHMLTNKPFLVCSVGKISLICWCLVSICTRTTDSPLRNRDKLEVLNSPQASLLVPFLLQQLLKHWIHHCHSSLLFSVGLAGGTSST